MIAAGQRQLVRSQLSHIHVLSLYRNKLLTLIQFINVYQQRKISERPYDTFWGYFFGYPAAQKHQVSTKILQNLQSGSACHKSLSAGELEVANDGRLNQLITEICFVESLLEIQDTDCSLVEFRQNAVADVQRDVLDEPSCRFSPKSP